MMGKEEGHGRRKGGKEEGHGGRGGGKSERPEE
jgi:hypothetical protein